MGTPRDTEDLEEKLTGILQFVSSGDELSNLVLQKIQDHMEFEDLFEILALEEQFADKKLVEDFFNQKPNGWRKMFEKLRKTWVPKIEKKIDFPDVKDRASFEKALRLYFNELVMS